jgi:predicted Rdx family selenoprotein
MNTAACVWSIKKKEAKVYKRKKKWEGIKEAKKERQRKRDEIK